MITCKDCIHYEICATMYETGRFVGSFDENVSLEAIYCDDFKDKANFEEVVRCKDCKHRRIPTRCSLWYGSSGNDDYFCEYGDGFYCAFGERMDGENDEDFC